MTEEAPIIFATSADFENWLESEHDKSDGVWLQIAKKDSGVVSVTHQEALDIALCYGWIDASRILPASISFCTFSTFTTDHGLCLRRGVKRCRKYWSSNPLRLASIQP